MTDTLEKLTSEVDPFLSYIGREKRYSENTVKAYRSDVIEFMNFIERCLVETPGTILNAGLIREYCLRLGSAKNSTKPGDLKRRKLSAASQERKLIGLKKFLKYLYEYKVLDDELSVHVELPRKGKTLPAHLSINEMQELLDTATGEDFISTRNLAILETLYATGCRVSEISGLDILAIDFENGSALVRGKGSKERRVLLGEYALRSIKRYLPLRIVKTPTENPALFINKDGKRLSIRGVQRIVKKAGIEAALSQDITPHALRHSFATHLLSGGADLRTIQELLGHSSLSTVQKYTHLDPGGLRDVHSRAHPLGDANSEISDLDP